MKTKKIRGHKRRWKAIVQWVEASRQFDVDALEICQRNFVKVNIHPWCDLDVLNSQTPEPNGKTRQYILNGLIQIYNAWKKSLNTLNEPYYLKIWLYEPRFSKSQVVCSIRDGTDFYNLTFHNPNLNKKLNPQNYGSLEKEMAKFNWEYRYDEEHINNTQLGHPDDYYAMENYHQERIKFEQRMKKPHRVTTYTEPIGDATEAYSFKKGVVWIGEILK